MGKGKGFPNKKPDLSQSPDIVNMVLVDTTIRRMESLLDAVVSHKLSPRCYGLMRKYAYMLPEHRLAVAIKTVTGLMVGSAYMDTSIKRCLTKDEYLVLSEIDSSSLPMELKQTAHSLLHIEARYKYMREFITLFRDMRTRKNQVLRKKPLD